MVLFHSYSSGFEGICFRNDLRSTSVLRLCFESKNSYSLSSTALRTATCWLERFLSQGGTHEVGGFLTTYVHISALPVSTKCVCVSAVTIYHQKPIRRLGTLNHNLSHDLLLFSKFTNLVYSPCHPSIMVPVAPFLCLAMMISALFLSSSGKSSRYLSSL